MGSADRLDFGAGARHAQLSATWRSWGARSRSRRDSGHQARRAGTAWRRSAGPVSAVRRASALVLDGNAGERPALRLRGQRRWSLRLGASHRTGAPSPRLYVTEFQHLAARRSRPPGTARAQREVEAEPPRCTGRTRWTRGVGRRRAICSDKSRAARSAVHQAARAGVQHRAGRLVEWGTGRRSSPRSGPTRRSQCARPSAQAYRRTSRALHGFLNISPGVAYAVRAAELTPGTSTNVTAASSGRAPSVPQSRRSTTALGLHRDAR